MLTTWILVAATSLMPVADDGVEMSFVASGATAKTGGYRPIRAEMSDDAEGVKTAPEGLESPMYGEFKLGDKSWGFIVDTPAEGDDKLYVDSNGDGDYTNDPAPEWNATDGTTSYRGSAQVELASGDLGSLGLYRFSPDDPRRAALKNTLLFYTDYGYEVTFTLDGKSFSSFVSGEPAEGMGLWIDRDGNQKRSYNLEMAKVGEPFNFTGTTYEIVMADGKLGLKVAESALPVAPLPPDLSVGKPALPFEAETLAGETIKFPGSFKGKVVMVDFWATWCGPCIAELPNVKAAYQAHHEAGFDVLSISFDRAGMADQVKAFTEKNEMPWTHLYEGKYWNTDIGKMYDVSSIPFVLLVDGDTGEILATAKDLRGEGLSDFIGKILAERKPAN